MKLLVNLLCLTTKYANADPKATINKQIGIANERMLDVFIVTGNDDTSEKIDFLLITIKSLNYFLKRSIKSISIVLINSLISKK